MEAWLVAGKLRHGAFPVVWGTQGWCWGWRHGGAPVSWWGGQRGAEPGWEASGEQCQVPEAAGGGERAGGCCAGARGANEAGDSPSWPAWPPGWQPRAAGPPQTPSAGQWRGKSRIWGAEWEAGMDGSRASTVPQLPCFSQPLCASSGAMALQDLGAAAALRRGMLGRHPQAPQPGRWGAMGEGGHSSAPGTSTASAVLAVRRDCLAIVCVFVNSGTY